MMITSVTVLNPDTHVGEKLLPVTYFNEHGVSMWIEDDRWLHMHDPNRGHTYFPLVNVLRFTAVGQ